MLTVSQDCTLMFQVSKKIYAVLLPVSQDYTIMLPFSKDYTIMLPVSHDCTFMLLVNQDHRWAHKALNAKALVLQALLFSA